MTEHEPLTPDVIYVVPSNRNVFVSNSSSEIARDGERRPKPSLNFLLSSAAEVYGDQLVAVILNGTGSDGAAGNAGRGRRNPREPRGQSMPGADGPCSNGRTPHARAYEACWSRLSGNILMPSRDGTCLPASWALPVYCGQ